MRPDLIVLVGLPGAGKSTFYREMFAATHALVSKDLLRNHHRPSQRQLVLLEEILREPRSVVLDNTNASFEERREVIELAKRYGSCVRACYFPPDLKGCLERNSHREGKACVPEVAIYATLKRLQVPSHTEGFAEIFLVHLVEKSFVIEQGMTD